MHYFAYGSNCNAAVMERKGVRYRSRVRATLADHRLLFNKLALREALPEGVGYANVEACAGAVVEGILYELEPDDLGALDASERFPGHYGRVDVVVQAEAGQVAAFTYRAQADKTADGLRPSRNYLDHILEGRDFLSRSYFEALERSQVFQGPCAACDVVREVVFQREGERIHMLCQPCREARVVWGTAHGRRLSVAETRAVMGLVQERGGFDSVRALVDEAAAAGVLDP